MRSVTITLTERDARAIQKQVEQWLGEGTAIAETRQALQQVDQQLRYQAGEQTTGARG